MTQLEKAQIEPLNGADKTPIKVLFNPSEYAIERSNVYSASTGPGMPSPLLQFVNGNADTLTMELFFDTYSEGERRDVREHTRRVLALTELDRTLHAPQLVRFVWGRSLSFQAVIERVGQKFTMFLSDGTPVRATLSVVFKEYKTIEEQLRKPHLESSDLSKRHRTQKGEQLWWIAAREYGDPADWRVIATANSVDDPRRIAPNTLLLLPPLDTKEARRVASA